MTPREINSPEELTALIGQDIGTSDWVEVTQDRVDTFADATDDHQWIHVDPERAKDSPFGGTIAHGFLTVSLVPMFGAQISKVTFGGARLNYGLDKVRFPTPVRVGSRIRATGHVEDVKETPKGIQLTTRYTIEVEGQERPACVASLISLITP